MKRLVFATNNSHKLEEARAILGDDLQLVSLSEIGCHDDIPETQPTLEGNALQKARYVHEHYGVDCVADDTGLMVDALDGAPGVYSARYAGPGHDSQANMKKLLENMEGVESRDAHFSTVLALVTEDGEHTFEGRVDGSIATEPSGNGGFGYDPVFIAKETGQTFADMDADAKNSISHRGRAFRLFRDWLAKLTVVILMLAAGTYADAAQWRQHMSYDGNTLRILESPKYTYFIPLKQLYSLAQEASTLRYGQLYRYDKDNDEWTWLNATNGLSENIVVCAAYDFKHGLLAVGYDNGNIDLLKDDGDKVNVPGLKMAGSNASSEIMDMNFDEGAGDLWVATSSGYVRIDPVKGEVITSRNYGRPVLSVAKSGDMLVVATPDGLLYGDERSGDLGSFRQVDNGSEKAFRRLIPFGNRVYGLYGSGWDYVGYFVNDTGSPRFVLRSASREYSMERGKDHIVTSGAKGVRIYDRNASMTEFELPSGIEGQNPTAASLDGRTWWFSAGRLGYMRMTRPDNGKEWTVTMDRYFPNASTAFMCVAMAYHPVYGMLVRNHGREQSFMDNSFTTPDLIAGLKDGEWKPLSIQYVDRKQEYDREFFVNNPSGLAIDPKNQNHIYCGSYENGLLRLNLEDRSKSLRIGRVNDDAVGRPGFVAAAEVMENWDKMCNFDAPVFDADGTMWTPFYNYNTNVAELWYWTAEDRLASIDAKNYRPMKKMILRNVVPSVGGTILPLSKANRLVYANGGNANTNTIVVLDHGGTLDNAADDVRHSITSFVDQDGTSFNYGRINHMLEDKSTGRVWVAASEGVYHFSPAEVLQGQTSVRRVKIDRNDGTNLADLLLDGASVNQIAIDPSGRKWFATSGAGIVVTSAAGTEVIRTYTTDNSEIPDNTVHGMCYNPDNGSMMISTGKGLCELFLSGAEASGKASARAYPNPVRPNFMGNVTIDMLPDQATVKITDTAGRLVRELGTASGGEIVWDLTNSQRKRVPAGIYYVLASNGPDRDSFSKMTKILVVE